MTILPLQTDGIATAAAALRDGDAVVVPFPSPLPYVVAATEKPTVNRAKRRPADQPCGILVSTANDVAPHLDLDPATVELCMSIAQIEQANLFVPVLPDAPRWLRAGAFQGLVGITLAWLRQMRPLANEFGHLFVSSANITSGPVGSSAPEADTVFDGRLLVLNGDPFRDALAPHGSATIIEVRRHGLLRVVRDGINNRCHGTDHDAYLRQLRARFARNDH